MIEPNIEDYILNKLLADDRDIALDFINYLKDNYLTFYKDNCECWKNKIYYWVKCGDGRRKTVFGKVFENVCGCTFRVDNPDHDDMAFLKVMVDIGIKEIHGLNNLEVTE